MSLWLLATDHSTDMPCRAWKHASEILPELSNALGEWLGASVIIAAAAPVDGSVKLKA